MHRRVPRIVVAVYVLVGAFAIHGVRYAIAPATAAERRAHGYLDALPPLLGGLLALALAVLALHVLRCRQSGDRRLRFRTRWVLGAAGFLAVYTAQESAEAIIAGAGLPSPSTLLAAGGWVVVPLAILAGAVLAALLRGTEVVLAQVARALHAGGERRHHPHCVAPLSRPPAPAPRPRTAVLARRLAGRAPPLAV